MRLSNESIDTKLNKCYQKDKGQIQAIIVDAKGKPNKERLLMALNLILKEKDMVDYFGPGIHSSHPAQKSIQDKEKDNSSIA